jgi:hypothetical protein
MRDRSKSDIEMQEQEDKNNKKITSCLAECAKYKKHLLEDIKANMKDSEPMTYEYYFNPSAPGHRTGIIGLIKDSKEDPKSFEKKPYLLALKKYEAAEDMANTLKERDSNSAEKLQLFQDGINKYRNLLVQNRDSRAEKFIKIVCSILLTGTVIGIGLVSSLWKTKGEKLIDKVDQTKQNELPRSKRQR